MSAIDALIEELNEHVIVYNVTGKHDDARLQYHLYRNTVQDYSEFTEMVGAYVQHVYSACVIHGGWISSVDAASIGKELLEQRSSGRYRDSNSVYKDCKDGLNGGVRGCLDILCEALKRQAVDRYVRDVFDRYLPKDDPDLRLRMVEEFIELYSPMLPGIDRDRPWSYVRDIESLIQAVVSATEQMATVYRRL